MKLLLLGSQHGNETLGDALYAHLREHHPDLLPTIEFVIGNPRAHKQNVRFTESDMNRSYNAQIATYESRRAQKIQRLIKHANFDLVLDLHTTACVQPPSVLVSDVTPQRVRYLRASFIDKIVVMRHPVVTSSLLHNNPNVVAIEINQNEVNVALLDNLAQDIRRYIKNQTLPMPRFAYPVDHLLLKSEVSLDQARKLINFKRSSAGFIPILTGKNSYKKNTHYMGFKALKEELITL